MTFRPSKKLTFEFANEKAAEHFKTWMSESGEQQYWEWMECRESELKGNITGINFDYNQESIIPVKCGRLERNE